MRDIEVILLPFPILSRRFNVVRDFIEEQFFRLAASGLVPRRLFRPKLPDSPPPPAGDLLDLEIVSHCWKYGRLLNYQLSSLVLHPPRNCRVTMTVFHCPEDSDTGHILDYFAGQRVTNVTWNWQPLEKERLFRRAIGRNQAALATRSDWIWFTDCDVTFQAGALDDLAAELCDHDAMLTFPQIHQVSEMLQPDDPIFTRAGQAPAILDLDLSRFEPERREKAVGGLQILRGDVARAVGYCANIGVYQRPATSFGNTWEDRTFRWLLGTHGEPLTTAGFYRIRHAPKGRKGSDFRVRPRD